MLKMKRNKINWRKGSGELIGFAIVLPLLMILIMGIVGVAQLGLTRMALEQAAYIGCRAGVVRSDAESAQYAAENAVKMRLGQAAFGIEQDDIEVALTPVAGITDTSTTTTPEWVKGTMVEMVVTVKVTTFLPLLPDTMQTSINMMVEQPARSNS